jgi:Zn finger protein HypA/HybF involved in hydrogenase expression
MGALRPSMVKSTLVFIENITGISQEKQDCIILALRKQIPQSPIKNINLENKTYVNNCPVCGQFLTANTDNIFKHCPTCGQKLKSGADDEE